MKKSWQLKGVKENKKEQAISSGRTFLGYLTSYICWLSPSFPDARSVCDTQEHVL